MRNIMTLVMAMSMVFGLSAQSVTPSVLASSGGEGSDGDHHAAWTMGELSISTLSNGDQILTQGFHQPKLLIVGTNDGHSDIGLKIYPNPTQDQLVVQYSGDLELDYILHDMRGVPSTSGRLGDGDTKVDVRDLPAGHYQMSIFNDNKIIRSVTIEKTGL